MSIASTPAFSVAQLPIDTALLKRVDWLTKMTIKLAARSTTARAYESLEYHVVHWKRPWAEAIASMRKISVRVSRLVDIVVLDNAELDAGRPMGDALAALPLDVLTCEEALALQDDGFRFEITIRFWPGIDGAATDDHLGRAATAKKRARNKAHTYYRTSGDAFIYARSFPRSLRTQRP
ncbi:MAG: hypothetical protein ACR2M1_04245 [Gemmatimonadaceae bacterium]